VSAHVDSVNIDPTAAQQTVLNLVVNARDAMPAGGTLTIGMENDHDELLLTVSDEGVGMSGDTLARAFDPFFTTKETGHGLGLSAVLGLVEQAGGDVQVTSAPDAGTTFELRLPTSGDHPAGDAGGGPRRRPAGAPARTERTVLVVEDTPFVRNLVVSYLESCGWRPRSHHAARRSSRSRSCSRSCRR
jgi:Histidine kinase-, DNA gyrase B-, and HSP90-like ATPase